MNEVDPDDSSPNPYYGIVTLSNQQKSNEQQNGSSPRGPGRPPVSEVSIDESTDSEDPVSILRKPPEIKKIICYFMKIVPKANPYPTCRGKLCHSCNLQTFWSAVERPHSNFMEYYVQQHR